MSNQFSSLILGGGGLKAYSMLGYLHYMYDRIENCRYYSGTSAGSVICALLSCGWKPVDILVKTSMSPFVDLVSLTNGITTFSTKFGFFDISATLAPVKEMIEEKLGDKNITFKEHYLLTGKFLQVTSTNLQKGCAVIFNHETYPDLCVIKAIEMSCNIPILFQKIIFEDCEYVDGEVVSKLTMDNIPINEENRCLVVVNRTPKSIVGVPRDESFTNYISRIFYTPIKNNNRVIENLLRDSPYTEVVNIIAPSWLKMIDNLSKKQKDELFKGGFEWGKFYATKRDYSGISVNDHEDWWEY